MKINFYTWQAHIYAVVFGLSSWLGVNGSFVQLPLLIKELPEQWTLASYLSIVVQLANIGPIVYSLFRRFYNNEKTDKWIIGGLLVLAILAMLFMSIFYNRTVQITGDNPTSVAFLILAWVFALVGCTSSVLFMPYMRHFNPKLLMSYFVGQGFSGLLPSIISLIQGIGDDDCNKTEKIAPLFNSTVFFALLTIFYFTSFVSFILLNRLRAIKRPEVLPNSESNSDYSLEEREMLPKRMTLTEVIFLNALAGSVCFFSNGFLTSIMTFSCMPYGAFTYHLSVSLSEAANPIACLIGPNLPEAGRYSIFSLTAVISIVVAYVSALAALSPNPPLQDSTTGIVLCILAWILAMGLIAYIKMAIARRLVSRPGPHSTGQALFYCGIWQQIGSCCGALTSFGLINFTDRFQSYTCPDP